VGTVPGKIRSNDRLISRSGAFTATLCAFFIALATRFEQFLPVVAGTSLGMMLANIQAVLVGNRIAHKLPVRAIRITAAVMFAALGILTIARGDG
jgi:putative Ca2+/H+ antiporter (TMEM165/GDT1 family)